MNINELAIRVYNQNKAVGWWDNPDRCIFQTLQLVNTEIAEATEGDRKSLMDDKLPHRLMAEVEMADTLIRLVDLAGHEHWVYRDGIPNSFLSLVENTGARHLVATITVCELGIELLRSAKSGKQNHAGKEATYCVAIATILKICEIEGYDIAGAVEEKLAFNVTREDHKRENRALEHGKSY